jgi:hypothetical protein
MKARRVKIGDRVRIIKIPRELPDSPEMDTRAVFKQALARTFRIEGFDQYGHLELVVRVRRPSPGRYHSDTIWIEPEFVEAVRAACAKSNCYPIGARYGVSLCQKGCYPMAVVFG